MSAATRNAVARNPQAARQDSGDAARRAPRGGDPRSGAGSTGSHADNRAQGFAAVSENDNGSAADGQSPEVIDVRHGMFGVRGSGDTSGYGRLVRPVALPGGTERPFGGWYDEVADGLDTALEKAGAQDAVEKVVLHRGQITFFIR